MIRKSSNVRRFRKSGMLLTTAVASAASLIPIHAARTDFWEGDFGDGVWQVNGGADWITVANVGNLLEPYIDGDSVVFGGANTPNGQIVTITGAVNPASISVLGDYYFTGTGTINTASMLVQGTGTVGSAGLALEYNNPYTIGTTTLANGGGISHVPSGVFLVT